MFLEDYSSNFEIWKYVSTGCFSKRLPRVSSSNEAHFHRLRVSWQINPEDVVLPGWNMKPRGFWNATKKSIPRFDWESPPSSILRPMRSWALSRILLRTRMKNESKELWSSTINIIAKIRGRSRVWNPLVGFASTGLKLTDHPTHQQ